MSRDQLYLVAVVVFLRLLTAWVPVLAITAAAGCASLYPRCIMSMIRSSVDRESFAASGVQQYKALPGASTCPVTNDTWFGIMIGRRLAASV